MKIEYNIIDVESLNGFFSLQLRSDSMNEVKVFKCYNDSDIKSLYYNVICKISKPNYFYSIDYDSTMINFLCKLVEKGYINIIGHLRRLNDLIIVHKLNYFKMNKYFWVDSKGIEDFKIAIEKTKRHFNSNGVNYFLDNYSSLLGKSKVFKGMIFNSIPKIMYYYTVQKDKSLKPIISLKNLQLILEGYQIKFDLNKYDSIDQIRADDLEDLWDEYSINDVNSLYNIFQGKPLEDIKIRLSAIEAVQRFNPEFRVSDSAIYSENNTSLITSILEIENPENVNIDYCEHIKTNHKKFNDFVEFCNNNKSIIYDKDLKTAYCEQFEKNYIEDDYNINFGEVQINSFDEIELKGVLCKFGLGG